MHEIALFVEDHAHRVVVRTLVERVAQEVGLAVHLHWDRVAVLSDGSPLNPVTRLSGTHRLLRSEWAGRDQSDRRACGRERH